MIFARSARGSIASQLQCATSSEVQPPPVYVHTRRRIRQSSSTNGTHIGCKICTATDKKHSRVTFLLRVHGANVSPHCLEVAADSSVCSRRTVTPRVVDSTLHRGGGRVSTAAAPQLIKPTLFVPRRHPPLFHGGTSLTAGRERPNVLNRSLLLSGAACCAKIAKNTSVTRVGCV